MSLNIFLSIESPTLEPARNTCERAASTFPRRTSSGHAEASCTAIPFCAAMATAGPVVMPTTSSPRAISALMTGAMAFIPPGSFALQSMRLGEFIFMRDDFFHGRNEEVHLPCRIRILAHIGESKFFFKHSLHDGTVSL